MGWWRRTPPRATRGKWLGVLRELFRLKEVVTAQGVQLFRALLGVRVLGWREEGGGAVRFRVGSAQLFTTFKPDNCVRGAGAQAYSRTVPEAEALAVAAALRPPWQVVEHAASGTIVRVAVCGGAREPLSAAQVRHVVPATTYPSFSTRVPARALAHPIARRPNISESHSETRVFVYQFSTPFRHTRG